MTTPELTETQKKKLRGLGHALKPVVIIAGAGLSDNVGHEIDDALRAHELIKLSVRVGDREARAALIDEICERYRARLIQRIGNSALLFRRNPEAPKITL